MGKACCPRSVAKFRGDHESVQSCPCDKDSNRIGWALSQHLWAQSQETDRHHWPPSFVHCLSPFGPQSSTGFTHVTHIAVCVAGVTQSRNSTGWPCYTCSSRLKISSNSVNSKCACKNKFVNAKRHHECEKETVLSYKQYEGKKQYMTMKKVILTCHYRVRNLCPLLSTN